MKNLIKTLFFSAAFMPLAAFAQNSTAQSTEAGFSQTKTSSPSKTVNKSTEMSEDAHYKVGKRNKKVGKMKYEVCETKEIEKGTRKGEIKTICAPQK